MKPFLILLVLITTGNSFAQNKELPYYEIPEYSETYTAGTVAARMVDGLGFRFYWATEGLTEKDLEFKPNEEVRTTGETVDHIYNLTMVILNSILNLPNNKVELAEMSFEDKRKQTLLNLKQAADTLRESEDISQYKIIFGDNEIPFWNNINGPIADAIWHSGQIASFRRSSGNPINPNINHFTGTVKD